MLRSLRLLTVVIAALGFASLSPVPAGATRAAASVDMRFVGTYAFHARVDGGEYQRGILVVHSDGTATDRHGGNVAHWSSYRRGFSMTLQNPPDIVTVYSGFLSAIGIGTRRHPGTWYSEAGYGGDWYAVRKS
jgi:hypothetical protein